MKSNLNKGRRNFIKVSATAGGGMLIGFNFLRCTSDKMPKEVAAAMRAIPDNWYNFDAYIKIGETGLVTIMSANPEIGQNVKTSMPMIVAEELDVNWHDVVVEQAPLNTEWYTRQVAGGSQSIRQGWETLRKAGAVARKMLVETAAEKWEVDASTCSVENGVVKSEDGLTIEYGALAADASLRELPDTENIELKNPKDFSIIGTSRKNVDLENIITGKPLFGIDFTREGMQYAVVMRPPGFGKILSAFDDREARKINGVNDVIRFGDKVAVLADNTWAAMKGQAALIATWQQKEKAEDTAYHSKTLIDHLQKKTETPLREDGDIEKAFDEADRVMERIFEAPFLPHSCMEPMNFFAHVTDEKVEMVGPIQTPQWTENRIAELLGRDKEEITIEMTRMGGGFGRRLYGDFALEAAEISSISKKPIKVIFSREDDMLAGTYRPASAYRFKVGIKDDKITAYHLTEAFYNGSMFGNMHSNFPCGAIENYRVDSHNIKSNITTGAWRAPYANFLAFAEQAFMDELAESLNQDPVQFRLDLLQQAKINPVGDPYNYEVEKFEGVIKLAAEKANWSENNKKHYGFSTYYSHNSYVAEIAELELDENVPVVKKVICAVDCGIVVNPLAALNQIEGGIIDGIGHALYGDFKFEDGRAQSDNYDAYRLIRMSEAPEIEVHFVESDNDPTGLGEPTLPPAGGALANALYSATGQRLYKQPFVLSEGLLG